MKNLKRLGVSFTLISVLVVAAFAGETPTGPSAPNCGQTNTPPCAAAPMTLGETNAPPASSAADAPSVTEVALDLLQSVLLFF
jgi:hypothetical protein